MKDYKRVLTIQDISCVGQCSLTVALPILSACGVETAVLPSAVLSTHTGGFSGFTFRDLTDDIPGIAAHWERSGIRFDAIYTGYLGSTRQIEMVSGIMDTLGKPNALNIVDPAMADNGKLYTGFTDEFVDKMRSLCARADILLPNITEASFLTGLEYRTEYDQTYVESLMDKLEELGAKSIVMTGVSFREGFTGALVRQNGTSRLYEHQKMSRGCHGTGDIYASAFTGALMRGKKVFEAAGIAAEYTLRCIVNTQNDPEHWYGAKFETAIPFLIRELEK